MKTRLEQKLLHKALSYKFDDSSILLDAALENPAHQEALKAKLKNVCAMISHPLAERLENTLGILRMSKREFIELAIIEALDKADLIMQEVDIDEDYNYWKQQQEEKNKEVA